MKANKRIRDLGRRIKRAFTTKPPAKPIVEQKVPQPKTETEIDKFLREFKESQEKKR